MAACIAEALQHILRSQPALQICGASCHPWP
jgi:hypothetical protein